MPVFITAEAEDNADIFWSIDRQSSNEMAERHDASSVLDSSETSSRDSEKPDNMYSDADLTDIVRAGKEKIPPCSHRGRCERSLICECCTKTYYIPSSNLLFCGY